MGLIGSHATVTGGLATGGLAYAAEVGAEVIQGFASNPGGWAAGPGDAAQDRVLRDSGLPVFIHAPYLINLGSGDPAVASKSASAVAHALQRGGEIGARGVGGEAAAMLDELVAAAGPGRVGLVHANDSLLGCGSKRDRHEALGAGEIGAEPFRELLAALGDVPFVVETPGGKAGHARDIATLKGLRAA